MKRIKELLSIKNDDNKIEIDAEIYNILCSGNIKQEETMEKVKQEAKRLWTIAITNKRATAIVIVAVIIIYHLITK